MSNRQHRRAILLLTLVFVGVSAVVHLTLGGLGTRFHVSSAPIPEQSAFPVSISQLPTPTPTPAPTQTPKLTRHVSNWPRFVSAVHPHNDAHQHSGHVDRVRPVPSTPGPVAASPVPGPIDAGPATPEPESTPIDARDQIIEATFRHEVKPEYPLIARDAEQEGTVIILVTIGADGHALDARIVQSSGSLAIDEEALRAARASSYYPPEIDGKPAIMTYRIVYTFQLT